MSQEAELQQELLELLLGSKVLSLATLNAEQEPEASLSPYLYHDGTLWVFLSRLSAHTQQLMDFPKTSVLICAQEQANTFAIERLSAQCQVNEEFENRDTILDLMTEKLGETVSLLRSLPDFHLFALKPVRGRYIKGFGQAYQIDFASMDLQHINPGKKDS